MTSKIEEYKAKQAELEAIKAVGRLTLIQIEYVEGGIQNMFSVPNASPLAVTAMLAYIHNHGEALMAAMLLEAEQAVETAKLEAVAEAEQFIAALN